MHFSIVYYYIMVPPNLPWLADCSVSKEAERKRGLQQLALLSSSEYRSAKYKFYTVKDAIFAGFLRRQMILPKIVLTVPGNTQAYAGTCGTYREFRSLPTSRLPTPWISSTISSSPYQLKYPPRCLRPEIWRFHHVRKVLLF